MCVRGVNRVKSSSCADTRMSATKHSISKNEIKVTASILNMMMESGGPSGKLYKMGNIVSTCTICKLLPPFKVFNYFNSLYSLAPERGVL